MPSQLFETLVIVDPLLNHLPASKILVQTSAGVLPLGTALELGGSALGVRLITAGTTDTVTSADSFIAWLSPAAGIKSETLQAATANQSIVIKDAYGTAGTSGNAIIITASGCTIDGHATLTLNANYQAVNLIWDGTSDWLVY